MMPGKWPWFERHFTFDFPPGKFPDIVERLRGTPARARELVHGLSPGVLTWRDGSAWSIQENVAHIADLEPLWTRRIDEMLAGAEVMSAADLTNAATFAGGHNDRSIGEVLDRVYAARGEIVERLEGLDDEQICRSSIHPRTKVPMRIVDLCAFVADHDDYHLARVTALKRLAPRS